MPGNGATFTLWLPLDQPVLSAREKPVPEGDQRRRLLIVDDEPEVLKGLSRVLSKDYRLELVESAAAAIVLLEADPAFDLILSDLVMPGRNGKELYLEVCRRWPELQPRFIFFTGGAFDLVLREFQSLMADRIIHKPLQSQEIKAVVSKHLRRVTREGK